MANIFLLILGVFWVVIGTLMVFVLDFAKKNFFDKIMKMDYKKMGVIPLVIGILLMLSKHASAFPVFIAILGILAVLKGLYFLVLPKEKIKSLMDWWVNSSNTFKRVHGVIAIILGVIVLISI